MPNRLFILSTLFVFLVVAQTAQSQDAGWKSYMQAGVKAQQQGKYAEAQKQFAAAATEAEHFGANDVRLGQTLNMLASVEQGLAHYEKAESAYKRALAIAEHDEGPNGRNVLQLQ